MKLWTKLSSGESECSLVVPLCNLNVQTLNKVCSSLSSLQPPPLHKLTTLHLQEPRLLPSWWPLAASWIDSHWIQGRSHTPLTARRNYKIENKHWRQQLDYTVILSRHNFPVLGTQKNTCLLKYVGSSTEIGENTCLCAENLGCTQEAWVKKMANTWLRFVKILAIRLVVLPFLHRNWWYERLMRSSEVFIFGEIYGGGLLLLGSSSLAHVKYLAIWFNKSSSFLYGTMKPWAERTKSGRISP
jgi:hypothetical protein